MKISVCMATFNGEKYIQEQLESILIQLNIHDEVIISDDSSTDSTIDIINNINDDRVTLLEGQKFSNPIFNFENALNNASNEIIFLSDQDDIWEYNKVETLLKKLKTYDLVVSDALIIDENGSEIKDSFYRINHSKKGILRNILKNSYLGCTMAFHRKILEKALPFPKDIPMHDWWIGVVSEIYGHPHFCHEKLIQYRRHENNASPTGERSRYSLINKFTFRLMLVKNILLRIVK